MKSLIQSLDESVQQLKGAGLNKMQIITNLKRNGYEMAQINGYFQMHERLAAENAYSIMSDDLNKNFKVFRDPKGVPALFKFDETKNEVKEVVQNALESHAIKILWSSGFKLSAKKVAEHVSTWVALANPLEEFPKAFSLNPDVIAFSHIQISIEEVETPTFDSFISCCGSNGEALKAFIWSIFEENDACQQYVLIKGEGKDGKGSLFRLLERLIGEKAFTGLSPSDAYWIAKLVGKRVGVFGDVNSTTFTLSQHFKSLTGNDSVSIQEKYRQSYSARLNAKIFVSTNNDPDITTKKSDIRRCIFVNIEQSPSHIPKYEERLWEERAGILYKCRASFSELFDPDLNEIKCHSENLNAYARDFEVAFEQIFETHFEASPNEWVPNNQVYGLIIGSLKSSQEYSKFIQWLERAHGIKRVERNVNGKKKRVLMGLKMTRVGLKE